MIKTGHWRKSGDKLQNRKNGINSKRINVKIQNKLCVDFSVLMKFDTKLPKVEEPLKKR